MERALFLSRLGTGLPGGYQRLYFGAEFCSWQMPRTEQALRALEAARKAGWAFTLATPVLIEPSLAPLRTLLADLLPAMATRDEVLVSDLGGLALVRELDPGRTVILGRTLSGQKRGPRIRQLSLTPDQLDYFRQGSWYGGEARQLLAEEGIGRVELDNLLQGVAPVPVGLKASLHYPYLFVTSTRNCPFRRENDPRACSGGCGERFTLQSEQTPETLLQGGNTQFLRHDTLPDDPASLGIDRLVFHPDLPR